MAQADDNEFGYTLTPDVSSAYTQPVGSPEGSFEITPTGGATYTVSIEVPKGLNGMEPTISIAYNSQAGNGKTDYMGSFTTTCHYDCYGNHTATEARGKNIWQLTGQTATTSEESLGDDFARQNTYNDRGLLTATTLLRQGQPLHAMSFSYDEQTDNLTGRSGMFPTPESFTYDAIDRLTGANDQTYTYDHLGNITSKTDIGMYRYKKDKPHAIASVRNIDGLISGARQDITYNVRGKVTQIVENGFRLTIDYSPEGDRVESCLYDCNDSLLRTTRYFDDYEEVEVNGVITQYYYLDGGTLFRKTLNGDSCLYRLFTDHLGSITRVYSEDGQEQFAATYDPWGRQEVLHNDLGFELMRGYTGHEMLPLFGLINMNGRVYDPLIGRFLSPDDFVPMADDGQSFNRYTYCLNNPLKFVDPNGELPFIIGLALISGAVNLGVHAINGDINSFWDGIAAFTIGAGSAVAGAYIGGAVFGLAGGSMFGIGGFVAGGAGGAGFAIGELAIQGIFNHLYFGDPLPSTRDYILSAGSAALFGGVINGCAAMRNGLSFWSGRPEIINLRQIDPVPIASTDAKVINLQPQSTVELSPYEKGQLGVEKAIAEFTEEGGEVLQREVSVNVNGVRSRFDFVGKKDDMLYFYEVKNGPYAAPTKNQRINIPRLMMHQAEFTPIGKNAEQVKDLAPFVTSKTPYTKKFTIVYKHYYGL